MLGFEMLQYLKKAEYSHILLVRTVLHSNSYSSFVSAGDGEWIANKNERCSSAKRDETWRFYYHILMVGVSCSVHLLRSYLLTKLRNVHKARRCE